MRPTTRARVAAVVVLLLGLAGCSPAPAASPARPADSAVRAETVSTGVTKAAARHPGPPRTLATGGYFTCVLASRQVRCWGAVPLYADATQPTLVPELEDAVEVGAGYLFACALRASGTVTCWGGNSAAQLGIGSDRYTDRGDVLGLEDARRIAVGSKGACALRANGAVVCWGFVDRGPLIDGEQRGPWPVTDLAGVVDIAVGSGFACARGEDDQIRCWSLLDPPTAVQPRPELAGTGFLGRGDRLCGDLAGEDDCWSVGRNGQLRFSPLPKGVSVAGAPDWVTRRDGGCVRDADGRVRCWDWRGLYGADSAATAPVPVAGLSDAVEIDAGDRHACARRHDGSIVCWGSNRFGQLGANAKTDTERGPVSISLDE